MNLSPLSENGALIGLTGDVMIGRLVEKTLSREDPAYLWGDLLPLLKSTDFNLINLEAALANSEKAVIKTFNFKAKPERVAALKIASVGACNLANNHCLDYSEEGLLETLETLERAGIPHAGAGRDLSEAKRPLLVKVRDLTIGILGYTDNEPDWIAGEEQPGVNFIRINEAGLAAVQQDIAKLRDDTDIVIVTIHWGPNMRERPTEQFRKFAKGVIDAGADIFHGHSAHIFQGVEIYRNKAILYDTGDFVDDYYVDPFLRNDRSFFFVVEVNKQGVAALTMIPTLIGSCQVNLSTGRDREETLKRMESLSQEFHTPLTRTELGLEWFSQSGLPEPR